VRLNTYFYDHSGWSHPFDTNMDSEQTLITVFGCSDLGFVSTALKEIKRSFPKSTIIGASTAGEILQEELFENSIVIAVAKFHSTKFRVSSKHVEDSESSYEDGVEIAQELCNEELAGILVLSDGLKVNGSRLTQGFNSALCKGTIVTGGLAGDDDRFEYTWVLVDGEPVTSCVTAVGFYGDKIQISHSSKGGWDALGVDRKVTKSVNNVLYELDDKPALDLYKQYLGDKANDLPASGLLFPLHLKDHETDGDSKVRTILGVDEAEKSITFAGDIPEGSIVNLMKANFDRLVEGAYQAAEQLKPHQTNSEDALCIAISCVGRKLVLKQRIEEELEATLEAMPEKTSQIGFYSYGEISPLASGRCDLHNQTMTLTLLSELDA